MNERARYYADRIFSKPSGNKKIFIDLVESLLEDYSWVISESTPNSLSLCNYSTTIALDESSIYIDDEEYNSYESYYRDLFYKKLPEGIFIKGKSIPYSGRPSSREWSYFLNESGGEWV